MWFSVVVPNPQSVTDLRYYARLAPPIMKDAKAKTTAAVRETLSKGSHACA